MRALVSAVFAGCIIALLLVAGCTDILSKPGVGGSGAVPLTKDSAGEGGGGKSGGSSSGSYPQNAYFSFDCKGEYRSTTSGNPPWNQHGKFTLTGNVPFPIDDDYNTLGYAVYPDVNAGRSDKSNPLHIQSELSGCWGAASDCKPCHFIYDGDIYASGMMVFDKSSGSERRWVVSFTPKAGGDGEIWHTNTFTQTESGCQETFEKDNNPILLIDPALSCYTGIEGANSATPFTFSDGSGFVISPHVQPQNLEFTRFDPKVVFHIGKAPS